jgi:Enoyl-CoA hydratase/isomerase
LRGNAGAGGAILALAADRVYAMSGVVLNPHYRSMGELYGSEYWTYLLPRRVGEQRALELTQSCKLIGTTAACDMGFLDDAFGADAEAFEAEVKERAQRLAQDPELRAMLRKKHESRLDDEQIKPLATYRSEELARMKFNFFGPDPAYHEARRRFVFKGNPPPPRNNRPTVSAQVGMSTSVHIKREAYPTLRDTALTSPYGGSNGFEHPPLRNGEDNAVQPDDELVVRLVKMLRRGVKALPFMRDQ